MAQMLKGLGLMGAGAYGYQHLQTHDMVGTLGRVVGSLDGHPGRLASSIGASTSGNEQMKVLQGEVDRLHQLLSDVVRGQKQPGYTVIHTGRNSWAFAFYSAAGVGLVYAYCRIRGISMWDLLYVSQNSMSQFKTTVTEGFTRIWDEVRKQKDEVMSKLGFVSQKQEQLMQSQALLDERLQQVGDSVDDVKVNTHNINNRVTKLDSKMSDMLDAMGNVQSGIMLLCQTVSEVTHRIGMNNTRSSQALKGFLSASPAAGMLTGSGGGAAAGAQPLPQLQGSSSIPLGGGSPSAGAALGLNALLDGPVVPTDGGATVTATPTTVVYDVTATGAEAGGAKERSAGGPPSFPKTAAKPTAAAGSSLPFWGMSRSTVL